MASKTTGKKQDEEVSSDKDEGFEAADVQDIDAVEDVDDADGDYAEEEEGEAKSEETTKARKK